jgi:hypothetical protein
MRSPARSIPGWAVALPLVAVAFIFFAAPKFFGPMLDPAVSIAGLPAGVVLVAAGSAAIALGVLALRTLTHRAGPWLAEAMTMAFVAGLVLIVSMVVSILKTLAS